MSSPHFATILIIGFFAWIIYRRVRRNIGRQPLHPHRATRSMFRLPITRTGLIAFAIVASYNRPTIITAA